jgi:PAS domain S-box-containing protein
MGKSTRKNKSFENLDTMPVAVIHCTSRTVHYANNTANDYFGKKHSLPQSLNDYFGNDAAQQVRRMLRLEDKQDDVVSVRGKVFNVRIGNLLRNPNRRELYLTDVTDIHRKLVGEKEEFEVFQNIVHCAEDGISLVDKDRLLFVNQKFLDLFGYSSPTQLIGKPITILVSPEDQERVLATSSARQTGGDVPVLYDYRGKKQNGEVIEIEVAASGIQYEGRTVSLSFHRDVTERNYLEKQLVKSEEFRKNIFSSLEQGIIVFNEKLKCIECNHQARFFTDVMRSEAIGMHTKQLFSKFKRQGILEKFENVLRGTKVSFGYLPYVHPITKQIRFAWLNLSPLLGGDGAIQGIVGVLSDLTHQKFMQDEIKESEELFRNVLEAMGDALVLTDLQGRVFRVNKEFERITGFREHEAVGQTIPYSWFYETDTPRFVVWIARLREKNYLRDFDIKWKSKSGRIIPISLNTTLLKNKDGDPVAMLNIARDITDRKKLETELQNRTRQIELINRIISKANETIEINDLLTMLDHELRQLIQFDLFGIVLLRGMDSVEEVAFTFDAETKKSRRKEQGSSTTSLGINIRGWGKAFFSNDLTRQLIDVQDIPLVRAGYKSLVTVPIYTKGTFLGVLYLATRRKNGFRGNEIDQLQPICEQTGLIVDKLNLFTKVRDDAQYINNLLYSMDDIVFTVDRELTVTKTNTPLKEFPFIDLRKARGSVHSLVGKPLYEVLTHAPYRKGIEQVIDALFAGNLSMHSTEFIHTVNGVRKHYQLRIKPMKFEGIILGLVFTHTDISALKNTEAELKLRNRDLIELHEISATMTKSVSLQEVYSITLDKIMNMFHASLVKVYLVKDDKINLSGCAGKLTKKEKREIREIDLVNSVVGQVFRTGEPVAISENISEEPTVSKQWRSIIQRLRLQSTIAIPLILQKKVLGALNIDFNHPRRISRQEMQLLLLISNQLSAAIENVRLYENLRERMNDLSILASLGTIYASSLDINEIADNVLERIKDLRQPDVLSISIIDTLENNVEVLRLVAAKGIPKEKISHIYTNVHSKIFKLMGKNDYLIVGDIKEEYPEFYDVLVRKDQRSIGYFLLKSEGKFLGLLSVGFVNYNKFHPEDVALYKNIATQVTMAIQNALLYQKIQESEEKYRLLVETAQDMVISMDLEGGFTYVSPSAKHITGYDPEEIQKQRFNPRMIHPGDYRYIDKLMRLASEQRMSHDSIRALEFRIRIRKGGYRWVSTSWTLVHDAHGQVTGVQCILRDVHERVLVEEEISQQLQRFRVLYELAHELAATLDRTDILNAVSKSVAQVLPYRDFLIYLYDEGKPGVLERIMKITHGNENQGILYPELVSLYDDPYHLERHVIKEHRLCDHPGDWTRPHKIVAPMIIKEKVLGLIVIEIDGTDSYSEIHKNLFQTITHQAGIAIEKASLYKETVEKSVEIEKRNRELDDFTYVVSHDLKEPLISIEGYSKILLADYREKFQQDGQELLISITQSCTRMKNLINELLTLSRVGRLTESMTPVSIDSVIREIMDDLEYIINKREVIIDTSPGLPIVLGNRVHLVVLFRNLLVNGIKFNTSDRPTIRIEWKDDGLMYEFSISDNGIGIEENSFDKIFAIFQRLKSDIRYEGTGAGLTIVKKIVETHGGKIWLTSMVGKGSAFYFTLPKPTTQ